MLTCWMIGSIECLGGHEVETCRYDRIGLPVDRGMLNHADRFLPDVIIYISQAAGPYVAEPSTFKRLRDIAPVVHLCFDAGDIGFAPLLQTYKDKQCFDVTVACDGCNIGPVDLVLFHPVDTRPYDKNLDRDIAFGTCGGFPYGLRKDVADRMVKNCGMIIKPREESYNSYQRYADFLKRCRIVLDCALSAGGFDGKGPYTRTLKTRAIEVGLAGACLLEVRNCALNKWAIEGFDYATYETPEEAEDVARDLMKNPERAEAMALRFHHKVKERMSPRVFWKEVFDYLLARSSLPEYQS
jgi:hypothetical protein